MGKPTGFKEIGRQERTYAPVADRVSHYSEFVISLSQDDVSQQGARCMDCGIPFCHQGCPVNNIIPDWNDLVYRGDWQEAIKVLHSTNNFPEFTGRICPAPCQDACTLNLHDAPVTIKTIECAIIDKAWEENWIRPQPARHKTGKKVAVVGSGPAGMACAQQLARVGHAVTVFEKQDRIGGLLRYGIPDFKLDKGLIDRRVAQMRAEGVDFQPNTEIGADMPAKRLLEDFDAVALTGGSEDPRLLKGTPGFEQDGIHAAMDFLRQNNKRVAGDKIAEQGEIHAKGKHVVVIGGGDTGSDCVGTSNRHGAASITQIELFPQKPPKIDKGTVWPDWQNIDRPSSSHEEGCERLFNITTKEFVGESGHVTGMRIAELEWHKDDGGRWQSSEKSGSERVIKADLVLLAMGFVHPIHEGMIEQLGLELDGRGNVKGETEGDHAYHTSLDKVFAAGDMRRGQSLVVWAIREGRQCAKAIDEYLMGSSELPR